MLTVYTNSILTEQFWKLKCKATPFKTVEKQRNYRKFNKMCTKSVY